MEKGASPDGRWETFLDEAISAVTGRNLMRTPRTFHSRWVSRKQYERQLILVAAMLGWAIGAWLAVWL
jgi:hypothetical protein